MNERILIIDDESSVHDVVRAYLERDGFIVYGASDGVTGLELATTKRPDLVILDLMLPDLSGEEICAELRSRSDVPILMLTAKSSEDQRVEGLQRGADDYLTKPFSFRELLARIHALLRRDAQLRPDVLQIGDLTVDSISHRVARADHEIQLTAKEYALLEYLARRAGQLVSRAEIAAHVWDDTFDPFSNTIEVYMNRLRKKIDGDYSIKLLHTRRGEGYMLEIRH